MVQLRLVSDDRRERSREKRRQRFLDAASALIDRDGLSGVTMQAIADELDCAIGTIYTYFNSKAALITALQTQAVEILEGSYITARTTWDEVLSDDGIDEGLIELVRLEAWAGFVTAAAVVFADEFELVRLLMAGKPAGGTADENMIVKDLVGRLLQPGRVLLDDAVAHDVIEPGDNLQRSLRWFSALLGVLGLESLAPIDRHLFRTNFHSRELTGDLLVGWGADRVDVEIASSHVEHLATLGPLAPPPEGPGFDS